MERECLDCGFSEVQTDKQLHGQTVNYSGWLHSNEYRRNALADNVTAQVIRDEKRNLFLHINETPITQWFKEQFGISQKETQRRGIRLKPIPFLVIGTYLCVFFNFWPEYRRFLLILHRAQMSITFYAQLSLSNLHLEMGLKSKSIHKKYAPLSANFPFVNRGSARPDRENGGVCAFLLPKSLCGPLG